MTEPSPFPAEFGPPDAIGHGPRTAHVSTSPDLVADAVISPPLRERMDRGNGPIGIVIELRVRYPGGVPAAAGPAGAGGPEGCRRRYVADRDRPRRPRHHPPHLAQLRDHGAHQSGSDGALLRRRPLRTGRARRPSIRLKQAPRAAQPC